MGQLAVGEIVLINFPFADLKGSKKRPAVVAAHSSLDTVILCQITSRQMPGVPGITVTENDFSEGGLPITSYIRPDKLFTVDTNVAGQVRLGILTAQKSMSLRLAVREIFS